MIVSNIYRYSPENAQKNVSTKKIRLDDTGSLFFQIEASSDSFIHLIESELVDLTINGKKGSETDEIYFSKILEALNRFLYQKEKTFGNTQIRMFIGLFRIDRVTFSVCGKYQVYFSQGSTITDIADGMGGRDLEFSYVSHGILTPRDSLYISNTTLLEFLTPEDLLEFSEDPEPTVVESLLAREIENERIDCLVFAPEGRTSLLESLTHTDHTGSSFLTSLVKTGQSLGTKSLDIFQRLRLRDRWITLQKSPWYITMTGDRRFRMGILVLGIGVALVFLYLIANSLFQASLGTAVPEEYKSKLIEAEQILARSTRDLWNKEAFEANINQAQKLIFEVRSQELFANDVQKLLADISSLKRQFNGIETLNPEINGELFPVKNDSFAIFENAKKITLLGKKSVYTPYVRWSEAKSLPLPDGEIAKSGDMTEEGVLYILTESNRIIKFLKGNFSYVTVEWQNTWQPSSVLKIFGNSLYLLSENRRELFRHRPTVNGFTGKIPLSEGVLFPENITISEFSMDGGIYFLRDDLLIEKAFTTPAFSKRSIILNKTPSNYTKTSSPVHLVSGGSGNYVYMLRENNILIFETDTRNIRDVRSLKYVGQIEVSDRTIRSFIVPKDGEITLLTNDGIFSLKFEISDGKVNVR